MILTLLQEIFSVIKFIFGLGALLGLCGIGLIVLWYVLRALTQALLRGQPADHSASLLRRLFLDR